jgi:hypothetical protein
VWNVPSRSPSVPSGRIVLKSGVPSATEDSTGLPEDSNAQTRCTAAERHATEESTAIGDAQKNLQAGLKGIPPYVVVQVQALTTKLDTKLKPEATAPDLINKLPPAMPVTSAILRQIRFRSTTSLTCRD